jgi:hypothetical protein
MQGLKSIALVTLIVTFAVILTSNCAYKKLAVPHEVEPVGIKVPIQQKLMAEAVKQATSQLHLDVIRGKKVQIEISGIFPHTRKDLLDYIRFSVAKELAENGAIIMKPEGLEEGEPDAKVVVNVSWGGIDTEFERKVKSDVLLAEISGILVGSVGLPLFGALIGDETVTIIMLIIGGGIYLISQTAMLIWAKPIKKYTKLIARVGLDIYVYQPEGVYTVHSEGSKEIVVGPGSRYVFY